MKQLLWQGQSSDSSFIPASFLFFSVDFKVRRRPIPERVLEARPKYQAELTNAPISHKCLLSDCVSKIDRAALLVIGPPCAN